MDVVRLGIEDISGSERYIKSENKLIMNILAYTHSLYITPHADRPTLDGDSRILETCLSPHRMKTV